MEQSYPSGDTGEQQRLKQVAPLTPGSLPTSTPRDIILESPSDIGTSAGAVTRFESNLDALRVLKLLESENRQATPQEQSTLAKYSGFGDSDYNSAFRTHIRADDPWKQRGDTLRSLVSEDEYRDLERSRLNAFYTSPEVISATWKALQRLGADNIANPHILEPSAGSGRFLGFQPVEMAARSQRTAVELDQLTGRMLRQTYPQSEVYVMGFEKAPIPKESVDIAISNVPFGDYPVHDPSYTKGQRRLTRQIHNYFFAKTLDKLRPGGVLAFITSHYTLDSTKAKPIRESLAEQADLVGAIRLPKTAFPDTEVVTDIVFMRKREPGDIPSDNSWVNSDVIELEAKSDSDYSRPVPVAINRYFIEHPEMVLGKHSTSGSMYGGGEYTVEPFEGRPLPTALNNSVDRLPEGIIKDSPTASMTRRSVPLPSSLNVREGARVLSEDGRILIKQGGALVGADMTTAEQERVKDMLAVRDAARRVLNTQLHDASTDDITMEQDKLRGVYDSFATRHGPLNADRNADLMRDDPDGPFLRALEKWDDKTAKKYKGVTSMPMESADSLKMPLFSERVVHGMGKRTITDEADAIAVSLNETGRLDFQRMGELLGEREDQIRDSLAEKRLIFKNPVGDWEPADKYLSGDVREKLRIAEAALTARPVYKANVEALKDVQPPDLTPGQISVRMGVPWIPAKYVNEFAADLLDSYTYKGASYYHYVESTGEWVKDDKIDAPYGKLTSEFGTGRMPANDIIFRLLNSKPVEVSDRVPGDNGDKSVRNIKETIAAQEKAAIIQDKFKEWIWNEPERAKHLLEIYNTTFNTTRPRVYDGKHQALPGMSVRWANQIHPHQKDAIWRTVQDRTTLLAHEVGFGKTAVMVGAGMELRRLGLSQKNLYIVPKATHEQFVNQFREVYPYANILSPGEADFTPARRTEFISRVVTGDWDAVILSDTQFQRIPVRPETESKFLKDEIDSYRVALEIEEEAASSGYGRRTRAKSATHKEIQKAIERLNVRLQDTMAKVGAKAEHTMYFEDLGVDQMFVDEADMYKNLRFATRMGRIKGLPNTDSERAWNMYQKCRYLQQSGAGQGVVFATGTPVANTIAEMYTQMRYLQEPMLEAKGIQHFDAWAKTFGETTETLEQTATGQYKLTQRFSKFSNTPELSKLWQNVADIRVAEEVESIVKQRPRLVNEKGQAKRTIVSCPPDDALLDYMKLLAKRADEVSSKDPTEDNMLKIANDARMASLDMRMVDPYAPINPNGKVATAAAKIAEIYQATNSNKGTQLVFLDLGTPKAAEKVRESATDEHIDEDTEQEQQVLRNVYGVLKGRLVASGIPENEVAFIHEAKNDKQKRVLFDKVNDGDVRVIIGSTGKLGTGVNVQERAAALHHLDAPWRPRDIEQREGRIIRQGNLIYGPKKDETGNVTDPGPGVRVYTYVTERSFDAFMWQAIEAKSKAIKSIMRRENPPRAIDDIDSFTMNAGEAKAIASGNPDIMKAMTLKNDVTRLQMLKASHTDARVRAKEQLQHIPREIESLNKDIAKMEQDAKLAQTEGPFAITIKGNTLTERADAGEALREAIANSTEIDAADKAQEIAKYKGFSVRVFNQGPGEGYKLLIVNPATGYTHNTTTIPAGELTATGSIQRIDNKVSDIPNAVEQSKHRLEQANKNLTTYQEQGEAPFLYQERLDNVINQLAILEKKLQGQELSPEALATVEDIITDLPEPEPEAFPAYRWGETQEEQKVEKEKRAEDKPEEPTTEPWQMTRKQLEDSVRAGTYDFKGLGTAGQASVRVKTGDDEVLKSMLNQHHGAAVTIAYAEGKPVPAEVIADYPELTKKEKTFEMLVPVKKAEPKAEVAAKAPTKEKTSYEYGKAAFESGAKAIPALDRVFMERMRGRPVGESTASLKEWIRGWTEANLAAPIPETKAAPMKVKERKPQIKKERRLLSAQQISDFEIGRDEVVRRGDKCFVVDTKGERADVEVQSDVLKTEEFAANLSKLTPEQKRRMGEVVRQTPYLSLEAKQERLPLLSEGRPAFEIIATKEPKAKVATAKPAAKKKLPTPTAAVKIKTPVKRRRLKTQSADYGSDEVARIQEGRSDRARQIDDALIAGRVVSRGLPGDWVKNPNRVDIPGVDAPRGTKITPIREREKVTQKPTSKSGRPKRVLLKSAGPAVRQRRGTLIR